jgi:hypothetical protein
MQKTRMKEAVEEIMMMTIYFLDRIPDRDI